MLKEKMIGSLIRFLGSGLLAAGRKI